jgi:hypothetical protein
MKAPVLYKKAVGRMFLFALRHDCPQLAATILLLLGLRIVSITKERNDRLKSAQ